MPSGRRHAGAASVRPRPSPRRRLGSISARRLSNPSAVTKPPASNSHRPSSTSLASRPFAATGRRRSLRRVFQSERALRGPDGRVRMHRVRRWRHQPVGILAQKQSNRARCESDARGGSPQWPDAAKPAPTSLRLKNKAHPETRDRTWQFGARKISDSQADGGNLVALNWRMIGVCRPRRAVGSRARLLPGFAGTLEIERRDRLDFAAQLAQRGAMNAGQDAAVAPFDVAVYYCENGPGSTCPCASSAQERDLDLFDAESQVSPASSVQWLRARVDSIQPDTNGI